jgi:hypothetical protein
LRGHGGFPLAAKRLEGHESTAGKEVFCLHGAVAGDSVEFGERVKRGWTRGQPAEQPSLPGSRKIGKLLEELELSRGAHKSGKPAIAPETKEWFERHYFPMMFVYSCAWRFINAGSSGVSCCDRARVPSRVVRRQVRF